jgi:hypothetical protein
MTCLRLTISFSLHSPTKRPTFPDWLFHSVLLTAHLALPLDSYQILSCQYETHEMHNILNIFYTKSLSPFALPQSVPCVRPHNFSEQPVFRFTAATLCGCCSEPVTVERIPLPGSCMSHKSIAEVQRICHTNDISLRADEVVMRVLGAGVCTVVPPPAPAWQVAY